LSFDTRMISESLSLILVVPLVFLLVFRDGRWHLLYLPPMTFTLPCAAFRSSFPQLLIFSRPDSLVGRIASGHLLTGDFCLPDHFFALPPPSRYEDEPIFSDFGHSVLPQTLLAEL